MKKYPTSPRTNREALAALVLGEIDTLLDKLEALQGDVNATGENIKVTINQLEAAGEKYNQAVLAANLRSKNEMLAYLETITATNIVKTTDEQRELVHLLIREAVSKEIITLKKVLSASSMNDQGSFIDRWGRLLICCGLTALMGSMITIELIKRLLIS